MMRIARVVEWLLDHACEWTGHAGGCWLLNRSPLRRLHAWALNTAWPLPPAGTSLSGATYRAEWPPRP